jgi:hypothetical protein
LGKSGNKRLAILARNDLANPAAAEEQMALADLWWDLCEEEEIVHQQAMRQRAAYWYQMSIGSLSRSDQLRISRRLKRSGVSDNLPKLHPVGTKGVSFWNPDGSKKPDLVQKAGFEWLEKHQLADGSWSFDLRRSCEGECDGHGEYGDSTIAATAIALLPFVRNGHTHRTGEYRTTVSKGIEFLVSRTKARRGRNGSDLREAGSGMYSHGMATQLICEMYFATGDEELKPMAESLVRFTTNSQESKSGGWRSDPRFPANTLVLAWQLPSLASARSSGLIVPEEPFRLASTFLASVKHPGGYGNDMPSPQSRECDLIGLYSEVLLSEDPTAMAPQVSKIATGKGTEDIYTLFLSDEAVQAFDFRKPLDDNTWHRWCSTKRSRLDEWVKTGHAKGSYRLTSYKPFQGGRLMSTALALCVYPGFTR